MTEVLQEQVPPPDAVVFGPALLQAPCDPGLPSAFSPVPHDYEIQDTEYDSLANGGSYEQLRCRACHRIAYHQLPD